MLDVSNGYGSGLWLSDSLWARPGASHGASPQAGIGRPVGLRWINQFPASSRRCFLKADRDNNGTYEAAEFSTFAADSGGYANQA